MVESDTLRLMLRATAVGELDSEFREDSAKAFWGALLKREQVRSGPHARMGRYPGEVLEQEFKVAFVRSLKSELVAYFRPLLLSDTGSGKKPVAASEGGRADELIPLIGIRVAAMRYGSLDLTIEFAGVRHLIELFNGNFDVFMMFAQAYLPGAFEGAMRELNFVDEAFLFDVSPSPELAAAFAASASALAPATAAPTSQAPAQTGRSPWVDRTRAVWQISNGTLLFPVALSLGVVYVAAKLVSEEKAELRAWQNNLAAREQVAAKSAQERITHLEKVQGELLTGLRDAAKTRGKKDQAP